MTLDEDDDDDDRDEAEVNEVGHTPADEDDALITTNDNAAAAADGDNNPTTNLFSSATGLSPVYIDCLAVFVPLPITDRWPYCIRH